MTSALVHIGMPKTGTTAIQSQLNAVADRLGRAGVFFRRYRKRSFSQLEIAVVGLSALGRPIPDEQYAAILGLTDPARMRGFAEAFETWLQDRLARGRFPKAVFSSEHVYYWINTPELIAATDAWLRRHFAEVRYVVYLREPVKFIPSLYSQMLRDGRDWTLDEFLADHADHDIARTLTDWAGVVGRDRIVLRLLEPEFLVNGSLIADFWSLLGLNPAEAGAPRVENRALPAGVVPFAIGLNRILNRRIADARLRKILRDAALFLAARVAPAAPIRLSDAQAEAIRARNLPRNETVRAMFFPDRTSLFSES